MKKEREEKEIIEKFKNILLIAALAFLIGEFLFLFLEYSELLPHSIFLSIFYTSFLLFLHPIFYWFVNKGIKVKLIFYLWAILILIGVALGVYLFGGIENFVAITYVAVIVAPYYLFSFKEGLIFTTLASLSYFLVLGLDYFNIIPHLSIWGLKEDFYFEKRLFFGAAFFNVLAFYAIGVLVGLLTKTTRKLEKEKRELIEKISERLKIEIEKKTEELEEAKAVLEIKVKARTRELEELNLALEEKIRERTKELQKRIRDLERFHQFVVGRELKMIELKKEIKKLQERLKRQKK